MSRKRSFEASSSSPQTGQAHKKRRHDYSEDDAQLAKIYEKLSDDLPAERLAATRQLKVFVRERPAHSPIGAISARLIRGLCSARKASRAGFYNALTELLWNASRTGHVGSILDRVLKQVDDETAPPKAASNAERHQHSLGKLTAFHALVTSGLLSATSVGAEQLRSFMHHTIDLATATAPLTEGCGRLWVDLAKAAAACKDYDKISIVMNVLNDAKSLKTPEGVAVWIACRPYMQKTKNVPVVWPNQDPLAAAPELLKCLVLALQDQEQPDGARAHNGYARRVPHFVWEMLLEDPEMTKKAWAIWESQEAKSSAGHSLHPPFGFWQSAFDDVFFEPRASAERKAVGLRVFQHAIKITPDQCLNMHLTRRLLTCFVNQLTGPNRYLHEAAHDVLEALKDRLNSDSYPATLHELLRALLRISGRNVIVDLAFLRKNSPLVEALIRASSYENLENAWMFFDRRLMEVNAKFHVDPSKFGDIGIALDHIVTFHATALEHDEDGRGGLSALIFAVLVVYALTTRSEIPMADREKCAPFAELAQKRMWMIAKLLLEKKKHVSLLEAAKLLGDYNSEKTWLATGSSEELPASISGFFHSRLPLLKDSLDKEPGGRISSNKCVEASKNEAFAALWTALIFMAYSGRDEGIALLNDLDDASDSPGSSRDDYIQIIMTLTSMGESVFRLVAEQAFAAFADGISSDGLRPLFDVLAQQENVAGQKELFDSGGGQNEEDSEDDEQDSDVEVVNGDAEAENTASNASSSVEEDGEESAAFDDGSDDDEADPNDEASNASLGRILQMQGLDTNGDIEPDGQEANAENSDSDLDADMTDSEMERLNIDDQLSSIFKQRAGISQGKDKAQAGEDKKKQQKESKRLVVTFKSRVLNLLSIYVQARYASRECLSVLVPLCQLIGSTRDAHLAKKASELLEKYISLCKKKSDGFPTKAKKETLWEILDEVHEEVLLWRGKQHLNACSRASVFLARVLIEKSKDAKHQGRGTKNAVNRLKQRYELTKERKAELKVDLPNTFWENFHGWLKSMELE